MVQYRGAPTLAGYFTLANKYISVSPKSISETQRKRLRKFAMYDPRTKAYHLSAPLIAQLGKNYSNGYDSLLSGDEILSIACDKVKGVQDVLGGRYVYLECEDKPVLTEFYARNGFCEFDRRKLDRDETDLEGDYLVQLLRYLK